MKVIPLVPQASQTLRSIVNNQSCSISLTQKDNGDTFFSLSVSGNPIITGVLVRDRVLLVRQAYLGFTGDFAFQDNEGTSDPYYTGLGSRWTLMYLEPADL